MAEPSLVSAFGAQRALLLRMLAARLGNAADAEDALQDLWVRIASLPAGQVDNPVAYLMRMAGNLATDRRIARGGACCWKRIGRTRGMRRTIGRHRSAKHLHATNCFGRTR